jgi:hypothetical protein
MTEALIKLYDREAVRQLCGSTDAGRQVSMCRGDRIL